MVSFELFRILFPVYMKTQTLKNLSKHAFKGQTVNVTLAASQKWNKDSWIVSFWYQGRAEHCKFVFLSYISPVRLDASLPKLGFQTKLTFRSKLVEQGA